VRYLHSEIDTLDRVEILRALRAGDFDVLVGVNLLREGLDLPEVSLVCILDADKEGFLRSATSLIQQMGRAARNLDSHVVMYADKVTRAMQQAIDETNRRRDKQIEYNKANNITPTQIKKAIRQGIEHELRARRIARDAVHASEEEFDINELTEQLETQMLSSAEDLDFEKAAELRDKLALLRSGNVGRDGKVKESELDNPEGPSAEASAPGAAGSRPRGSKKRKKRRH
jgi:excinuclease ABC subunit B